MLKEYLIKTIHNYFDFLFKDYDFKEFFVTETVRVIYFFYKKHDFLVRINYSHVNHTLDIDFYKETDVDRLIGADSIGLGHIMKDKNLSYDFKRDWEAIMPHKIPLEESAKNLSELLKIYGDSYLKGREWKTWRDIRK